MEALAEAGCRDFLVSTWWEAEQLGPIPDGLSLSVLHGPGPDDVDWQCPADTEFAGAGCKMEGDRRRPPCDVMIDTGMNRLGLRPEEAGVLDGLNTETLLSHLACADEDHPLNAIQLERFRAAVSSIPARRHSLANSAGICLGTDYSFDLVRPGLALYGGIPRKEAEDHIRQVAHLEAQVIQRRRIPAGESVGYYATVVPDFDREAVVVNVGYADGYFRGFSNRGGARFGGEILPVLGRVSMDLLIIACDGVQIAEGDRVEIEFDLKYSAMVSDMSQYELLTGLGSRFQRVWR